MKKGINKGLEVPLFNHMATAAAVGLLMQPAAIIDSSTQRLCTSELRVCVSREQTDDAMAVIKDLTKKIRSTYIRLVNADSSLIPILQESGDIEAGMQIEMQFRSLEGVLRSLYLSESQDQREVVKPFYQAVVEARDAISKMNSLLNQANRPVDGYESSISMEGLRALAERGTAVLKSDNFH